MVTSSFDFALFINTIFVAAIGSFFGSILGAWLTHHLQKKRDDVAWEREKDKIQRQHTHDSEMLVAQFELKMKEFQQQLQRDANNHVRESLTKGIDTPDQAIRELQAVSNMQAIIDELKGREPRELKINLKGGKS